MNNVSFRGLGLTKQGNPYEKCKTGRRVGSVVGFLGGAAVIGGTGGILPLGIAAKICSKNKKAAPYLMAIAAGISVLSVVATTLAGRLIGAIPDSLVNKSRKKDADVLAMSKNA